MATHFTVKGNQPWINRSTFNNKYVENNYVAKKRIDGEDARLSYAKVRVQLSGITGQWCYRSVVLQVSGITGQWYHRSAVLAFRKRPWFDSWT